MNEELETKKVTAIYDLRAAMELKVRTEVAAELWPSPSSKDALLDASLKVEEKTQEAIDSCMDCGHTHSPDNPHGARSADGCADGGCGPSNVVDVDFRPDGPKAKRKTAG